MSGDGMPGRGYPRTVDVGARSSQHRTPQAATNLNLVISLGAPNRSGGPQYPVPGLVYTHSCFKRCKPAV